LSSGTLGKLQPQSAAELRGRLVDGLVADRTITCAAVEAAFRAVPRHLFAPGVPLAQVYERAIVVVKQDQHGVPISTMSAPEIQARMLEQAAISAGMRVLEIGSGGVNAALLEELTGPDGQVTTVDIFPDVTDRARALLAEAGYPAVRVVLADAEAGMPQFAPYDRILVTAGAWDVPPAWTEQLAPAGRIVVPLRMRGVTRSLALERADGGERLVSRSAQVCGFVRMQGAGSHQERLWLLRGRRVGLRFDDGTPGDPGLLDGVLGGEPVSAWSGVVVGRAEPFETLPLWLATSLAGFCVLAADGSEGDPGLAVEPGGRWFPYAAVDAASFAYLSSRPAGEDTVEFGAHGYGPRAARVASEMTRQVAIWDRDFRGRPCPDISVWPLGTPPALMSARGASTAIITKAHRHVTISWPRAGGQVAGHACPPAQDEKEQ
jgi:protein-L-isoaspartate(D-aspartate) O-methyltransferase